MEKLSALKTKSGKSLSKLLRNEHVFKGIQLTKFECDCDRFAQIKSQFYQALCDNLAARFPCTELMNAAKVFDKSSWPKEAMELALYGDKEVAYLAKKLQFSSDDAARLVFDFAKFKRSALATERLAAFITNLAVYPVSSADCERGFSQMNLHHTHLRNRLQTSTVDSLLMVSVNEPPVHKWNVWPYVLSWLAKGRKDAYAALTGPRPANKKK